MVRAGIGNCEGARDGRGAIGCKKRLQDAAVVGVTGS